MQTGDAACEFSHLQLDVTAPPAAGRVSEVDDARLRGNLQAIQEGKGNAVGTWPNKEQR